MAIKSCLTNVGNFLALAHVIGNTGSFSSISPVSVCVCIRVQVYAFKKPSTRRVNIFILGERSSISVCGRAIIASAEFQHRTPSNPRAFEAIAATHFSVCSL